MLGLVPVLSPSANGRVLPPRVMTLNKRAGCLCPWRNQVFCKMYKWRYEDFYLSTHGFTGIPQDNEPKHNEMRHLV